YSAANVAPMMHGVKVLVRAAAPLAVLADAKVIENAPFEMTASGFGDAVAKSMSSADWLMNNLLFGEHFCPFCNRIVESLERFYLERPEDVRARTPAAVEALFKGLFWSGAAMTMIGTSAPASGGEHLLSHTLDMMAARDGLTHDLHGRQVGLGSVFSAALYERLLAQDRFQPAPPASDVDASFWGKTELGRAVREQWLAKKDELEKMGKLLLENERWQTLRTKLAETVPSPAEVRNWLLRAGAACTIDDIGCTRRRLREALLHMHEIRKRPTVVDLAWMAGIMPGAADEIIDRWMVG
ncbi:MAG TPA: iron-containing alcohol dehydrogenase, partial [Sedimentisphaerales bacterium]|nr:iron-containing alcohol dehydrogenase [Sedimentisphaerales bacterium]